MAKEWLGNAAAVTDLWTISAPSGTIVSQVYSITINSKSVTYTAGGADTATIILAGLLAALTSTTSPTPQEFQELTWAALPVGGPYTSLTGTQKTSGRPSTISTSTSGAAGGFASTNTTVATGPNFFDNGQNWSGGIAPTNSDTLTFDVGNVGCWYNINTALTGIVININEGYTGSIGLPAVNVIGQNIYAEYRTQYLTLAGGTALINSSGITRCKLAFGSNLATVRVLNNAQRPDPNVPVVLITGGNGSSTLDISKGDAGVAFYDSTTATFLTINSSYLTQPQGDVNLICGKGATLTTINKNGGTLTLRASATTVSQQSAGGTLNITDAAAITTLNAFGGIVNFETSGTVATINLYGQTKFDCSGDTRAHTITNPINVFDARVQIIDAMKTINSGTLSINGEGIASCSFNHGDITTLVAT